MKRLIVLMVVLFVSSSMVYAGGGWQASCWKPKCIPQQTLNASQGGSLNVSTLAVGGSSHGWKKCGFKSSPSIVESSASGVVSRSSEADGKTGYAGSNSMTIFQQNALAGKGGIAANELSQESGGAAKVSKKGLGAMSGSTLNMSSMAAGNATASQSLVSQNNSVAIGKSGVAATGEVIGVVMINTAIGGGVATSNVNIAGGEAASVK